ncbi:unnamed protein product [Gongylonema pulchrum]|uniref:Alpha-mannosidase n=1 Tax=Gongylonema pulchrum TaxID=637853 RepID=A0A183DA90_9BILA|nr:unnamed protein product [Gongylonema pulchrum]
MKEKKFQYGAENPFTLLHDYMGHLLSWENTSGFEHTSNTPISDDADICAFAYTLIKPTRPYENNDFHITLKVVNKKNSSLDSVKVSLEMTRNGVTTALIQFRQSPAILNGIGTVDGTSRLLSNASFTARWKLKPVNNVRLTHDAQYQVSGPLS